MHGGGQGSWVWAPLISALKNRARGAIKGAITDAITTVALDVPGCGTKRDRKTDDLTLPDVADELITELENQGLSQVILVGHSQAGQLMAQMALRKPGLFSQLVFIACSIPLPGQTVMQMLGTSLHGENDAEVGWPLSPAESDITSRYQAMFCNDMSDQQSKAFFQQLGYDNWPAKTYAFTDWQTEHLASIPSTFVLCRQDQSLPLNWQKIFANRFKANTTLSIDAGHQAMLTQPESLAKLLWLHWQGR